ASYELSSRAKRGICILRRAADPSLRSGWQNLWEWEIMRHPLRKIALIGGGVVLPIVLAIIAEWVWSIKTPGAYVTAVLFPTLAGGSYDLRLVLLVLIGVD